MFSKEYQIILDALRSILRAEDRLCEIGCGSGLVSFEMAKLVNFVVGIDISESMIEVANERKIEDGFSNIDFYRSNDKINGQQGSFSSFSHEKLENELFDKILFCNVLHVMKNPEENIEDSLKMLKENGEIIMITYCHGEPIRRLRDRILSATMKLLNRLGRLPGYQRFTFQDLRDLCSKNRLKIISENRIDNGKSFPCLMIQAKNYV